MAPMPVRVPTVVVVPVPVVLPVVLLPRLPGLKPSTAVTSSSSAHRGAHRRGGSKAMLGGRGTEVHTVHPVHTVPVPARVRAHAQCTVIMCTSHFESATRSKTKTC